MEANHHISILSKSYTLQCNYSYDHSMHSHNNNKKVTTILCAYASSLCVVGVQKRKKKKIQNKQKKRSKINLILSHVNHTFLIFEPSNWTSSLSIHSLYLSKKCFCYREEAFYSRFNLLQVGPWTLV